jgi:hypothetical protein
MADKELAHPVDDAPRGKRRKMTEDVDFGPGVVLTPGYEFVEPEEKPQMIFSDRRVDHHGIPADHPITSTYKGKLAGVKGGEVHPHTQEL